MLMSPNYEECPWDSCRKSICSGKEETRSSDMNAVGFSRNCSNLSATSNICADPVPKKNGHVYKRRKLQGNSVAFLSEENASNTKQSAPCSSAISSDDHLLTAKKDDPGIVPIICENDCSEDLQENGNPLISGQHCCHRQAATLSSQIESVANFLPHNICSIREEKAPVEASAGNLHNSTMEHSTNVNDRWSSSKCNLEHGSTSVKAEVDDAGECSSSDVAVVEPFGEFTSAKELCISVLKSHGLLGEAWMPRTNSAEALRYDDSKPSQSCKRCGLTENPLKMLICDLCEEAFHLPCCNPRVKKLPVDEWYCQPCFRKKPKPFMQSSTEKSFNIKDAKSEHRRRTCNGDVDPISFMLNDSQPYTTGVRIGKDFQAEVPDWSGPISSNHDYFDEPSELDPTEFASLNGWNCNKSSKPNSIGNWVQCQEVIGTNEIDDEIVCGKWRRAPLFVTQTDDWDCSCAVIWDPIHADCAVPQELDTEEVLKHLRYIEMLRPRLAEKKRKPSQT